MEVPTYFNDFLKDIRPTQSQRDNACSGHLALRRRLADDDDLAPIIVSTFLQGSYRRSTAIRPAGGRRSDVDVVVVTTLDAVEWAPKKAIDRFIPFVERHYRGKYSLAGRAIQIELAHVDLDLVVTAAPSESQTGLYKSAAVTALEGLEETGGWGLDELVLEKAVAGSAWQMEPLLIPDREAGAWDPTHPLEQIQWTSSKNSRCDGHYVGVVKAIKWWRRVMQPEPKYPKGYPLEHIVGECCPDGIGSVAEGVTLTLEEIAARYAGEAAAGAVPWLADRGVLTHNVLARLSAADFHDFHAQVCDAAGTARRALDADGVQASANAWLQLFGRRFPEPPGLPGPRGDDGSPKGGYTPREDPSVLGGARFA